MCGQALLLRGFEDRSDRLVDWPSLGRCRLGRYLEVARVDLLRVSFAAGHLVDRFTRETAIGSQRVARQPAVGPGFLGPGALARWSAIPWTAGCGWMTRRTSTRSSFAVNATSSLLWSKTRLD